MHSTIRSNNFYSFASRWIFSTNHKDIGTLYLLFGAISGVAGTIPLIICLGFVVASIIHVVNWNIFAYALNAQNKKNNKILNRALAYTHLEVTQDLLQVLEIQEINGSYLVCLPGTSDVVKSAN